MHRHGDPSAAWFHQSTQVAEPIEGVPAGTH